MDGGSADYCNEVAGKNPSQWGGVWKPQHKMITEVQTQVSVVLGLWSEVKHFHQPLSVVVILKADKLFKIMKNPRLSTQTLKSLMTLV
jgi:hypothetical protein